MNFDFHFMIVFHRILLRVQVNFNIIAPNVVVEGFKKILILFAANIWEGNYLCTNLYAEFRRRVKGIRRECGGKNSYEIWIINLFSTSFDLMWNFPRLLEFFPSFLSPGTVCINHCCWWCVSRGEFCRFTEFNYSSSSRMSSIELAEFVDYMSWNAVKYLQLLWVMWCVVLCYAVMSKPTTSMPTVSWSLVAQVATCSCIHGEWHPILAEAETI